MASLLEDRILEEQRSVIKFLVVESVKSCEKLFRMLIQHEKSCKNRAYLVKCIDVLEAAEQV